MENDTQAKYKDTMTKALATCNYQTSAKYNEIAQKQKKCGEVDFWRLLG